MTFGALEVQPTASVLEHLDPQGPAATNTQVGPGAQIPMVCTRSHKYMVPIIEALHVLLGYFGPCRAVWILLELVWTIPALYRPIVLKKIRDLRSPFGL